jgi:hypothetical protein
MADIPFDVLTNKKALITKARQNRLPFWGIWRDLAQYLLPSRYSWLESAAEASNNQRVQNIRNSAILDGTGTRAARTLAAGMMNGITSPARPWFKLRLAGFSDNISYASRVWLDEVERRMMQVMAESNFYQAIAVTYLDLVVFGTACTIMYDDAERVIHCSNSALGEFYLLIDDNKRVCGVVREMDWDVYQTVRKFGEENVSQLVRDAYRAGGSQLLTSVRVVHLIEPNDPGRPESIAPHFGHREFFYEERSTDTLANGNAKILSKRGYVEFPGICPRWELAGNDAYGTSPGMDALGDIIQLQFETKEKAKGISKMNSPPMLADITMSGKQTSMVPNSVTYVPRLSAEAGMRPAYQVVPPLGEMTADLQDIRQRVRETFYNFLFTDIMQLDTVRSATEISARQEEKLVLLGPVLERFENECLDPAIRRTFGIMVRRKLLPPPPPDIADKDLTIQYVSILAAAQSAVGTAPTERLLQILGSLVGVFPEAALVPNIPELLVDYARDIGVKQKNVNSLDDIKQSIAAMNQQHAQQQQMEQANQAAQAGQTLSQTDVGGGANAAQVLLGRA